MIVYIGSRDNVVVALHVRTWTMLLITGARLVRLTLTRLAAMERSRPITPPRLLAAATGGATVVPRLPLQPRAVN